MTNKTNTAMFALAMIAVIGMGVTPAFAAGAVINNGPLSAPDGTTTTDGPKSASCVSGTCKATLKVYNNNPTDKVRVYYDVISSTCDINVVIKVNGSTVLNWTRGSPYSGTGEFVGVSTPIISTDSVTSTTNFTNCS